MSVDVAAAEAGRKRREESVKREGNAEDVACLAGRNSSGGMTENISLVSTIKVY
jgi:hypothetical protein